MTNSNKRVYVIVLDACGIGAMPDWQSYDDPEGANTIANVAKYRATQQRPIALPHMAALGLGHIHDIIGVERVAAPVGVWAKLGEKSEGKDTTTGHWEIAGLPLSKPFPVYPNGFPQHIIDRFVAETGCGGVLCNLPYSGTECLKDYGKEHLETGYPIVYTSADSVFQIATHTDVTDLDTLYRWCEIAREILRGEHEVSRVIARPFHGAEGAFSRLSEARHDYAVFPTGDTLLTFLQGHGVETVSIGKIADIFCQIGLDTVLSGKSNEACMAHVTDMMQNRPESLDKSQLVFVNLVETDSHFGHRNDPEGFAAALEKIDIEVGKWMQMMHADDLMILTADHGCDPTVPGTDHTREYVPMMMYGYGKTGGLDTRDSFADISATVADAYGLSEQYAQSALIGQSFLNA